MAAAPLVEGLGMQNEGRRTSTQPTAQTAAPDLYKLLLLPCIWKRTAWGRDLELGELGGQEIGPRFNLED